MIQICSWANPSQDLEFEISKFIQNFDYKYISGDILLCTQNCHLNSNSTHCGRESEMAKVCPRSCSLNVTLHPNSWAQFRSKYFGQNLENASNFSFFLLLLYKLVFPYFSISFLLDTIIQWMIYFDKRTFERKKNC